MKKIALTSSVKELGVSQPTLSRWESERNAPSIEGLIRMSEYYHVSTDFLLGFYRGGSFGRAEKT
nr:helix-turn-helix transcriptional regulator [Catenibacillus scindens]